MGRKAHKEQHCQKKKIGERKQLLDVQVAEHISFNTPFTELRSSIVHAELAHDLVASANVGWLHKHAVSVLRIETTLKI